jgi:diketogulonate reductase-like aldo/keto reductase
MKTEACNNFNIPKIGFGTWCIGGKGYADFSQDGPSMRALHSALQLGYTHFDTAEVYAAGHAEELLGQVIREEKFPREKLFITSKVSPEHLNYSDVLTSFHGSLRRLGLDYLDLYLIHWPKPGMKLVETFFALNQLVREGLIHHLGVSNFNLQLLKQAQTLSESQLLTNQVSYSLPDRTCVENGVLEYCQSNNIFLTAYSPIKRRNIKSNKILQEIAKRRGVTPQQIALSWLISQPRVITIPMSMNPIHQVENFEAGDLVLNKSEMEELG